MILSSFNCFRLIFINLDSNYNCRVEQLTTCIYHPADVFIKHTSSLQFLFIFLQSFLSSLSVIDRYFVIFQQSWSYYIAVASLAWFTSRNCPLLPSYKLQVLRQVKVPPLKVVKFLLRLPLPAVPTPKRHKRQILHKPQVHFRRVLKPLLLDMFLQANSTPEKRQQRPATRQSL